MKKTESEYYDSETDFQDYIFENFIKTTKETTSDEKESIGTTQRTEVLNFGKTFELEEFFMINMNGSQLDK